MAFDAKILIDKDKRVLFPPVPSSYKWVAGELRTPGGEVLNVPMAEGAQAVRLIPLTQGVAQQIQTHQQDGFDENGEPVYPDWHTRPERWTTNDGDELLDVEP